MSESDLHAAFQSAFHNCYSTALVADAAYRVGASPHVPRPGFAPLEQGAGIVGPVGIGLVPQ